MVIPERQHPVISVNYNSSLRLYTGTAGASAGGVWRCTEGPAPVININLKVLLEGMYDASANQLNRRDTVSMYLRDAVSPYRLRDSAKEIIDTITFSATYNFTNTLSGNYYLVVKYFNTIETWSEEGGESISSTGPVYSYDFTTAASKAYGNNQTLVNGNYCIFSGDVQQDGLIDLSDIVLVYNDVTNFLTGYIPTDVNGDNMADLSDLVITYNNASNFAHTITP